MFEIAGGVIRKLLITAILSRRAPGSQRPERGRAAKEMPRHQCGPRFGGSQMEWGDLTYCMGFHEASYVFIGVEHACIPDTVDNGRPISISTLSSSTRAARFWFSPPSRRPTHAVEESHDYVRSRSRRSVGTDRAVCLFCMLAAHLEG